MEILKHIPNATREAIYWWNRTEGYYHQYFRQLDKLKKDPRAFDFFVAKVFQVFLTEYSVRRNIASGEESVRCFVEMLVESGFFQHVDSGQLDAVDQFSDKFSNNSVHTNGRKTLSLLSKVAFMINPSDFSLMDSYAKNSLWTLIKEDRNIKRSELESYMGFASQIDRYIKKNKKIFKEAHSLLQDFQETAAFTFFTKNPAAFERRVFDKLLWLNVVASKKSNVDNSGYKAFLSYSLG